MSWNGTSTATTSAVSGSGETDGDGDDWYKMTDASGITKISFKSGSSMPYEEKSKLLAMHQASQTNAGWYVIIVLVIYFGALAVLLKRKGYLSQQYYYPTIEHCCCPTRSTSPSYSTRQQPVAEAPYSASVSSLLINNTNNGNRQKPAGSSPSTSPHLIALQPRNPTAAPNDQYEHYPNIIVTSTRI